MPQSGWDKNLNSWIHGIDTNLGFFSGPDSMNIKIHWKRIFRIFKIHQAFFYCVCALMYYLGGNGSNLNMKKRIKNIICVKFHVQNVAGIFYLWTYKVFEVVIDLSSILAIIFIKIPCDMMTKTHDRSDAEITIDRSKHSYGIF